MYRLVYALSPQAIPSSYDPVREAEEITLKSAQQAASPANPVAETLWQRLRTLTVRSALSSPLRALGTITLGAGVAYFGWKIGEGINAKFLKIGLYEPPPAPPGPITYQLRFYSSVNKWRFENNYGRASWYPGYFQQRHNDCDPYGIEAAPEGMDPVTLQTNINCTVNGPAVQSDVVEYYGAEDFLPQAAPIEDYHGQSYDRATAAPNPPAQSTVEQLIDTELDKPENAILRQWINYQLGSPGEQNPLVASVPDCDGMSVATCDQRLRDAGFTHITTTVRAEPDYTHDPSVVTDTQPEAGTEGDLGDAIEIVANPDAPGVAEKTPRDEEDCAHTPKTPLPAGDPWDSVEEFYAHDHSDPVQLYRGTPWWGRSHISLAHGWGDFERANVSAALSATTFPPEDVTNPTLRANGSYAYYYPWVSENGHTHCTTVVIVRYNLDPASSDDPMPKSIITSFGYVGWYRK